MERKDELIEVLRDRFAGHEVAVPPAAWDAITSQLALGAATSTDLVSDLLRERFSGHEAEVDPGVWDAIEHQVTLADPVNSLLRDRFNGHEVPVPTAAWTAIEGQLGHGAAAASGSSLLGWVAGGAAALLVAGGLYLAAESPSAPDAERTAVTLQAPVTPTDAPATTTQDGAAGTTTGSTAPAETAAQRPEAPATTTAPQADRARPEASTRPDDARMHDLHAASTPERSEGNTGAVAAHPEVQADVPSPAGTQPIATFTSEPEGRQVVQEVLRELNRGEDRPAQPETPVQEEPVAEPEPSPLNEAVAEPVLFIPNVFTPNGDGENEQWVPQGSHYQRVAVRIFSGATGALVFTSNDLRAWDGNDLQGHPCPSGTYLYAIEVEDLAGKARAYSNTVNIIR
ncbi:MAG: gliding motility-associated C-terminal domain-containing protein [Flavobacteriales bacterium]|nr:gliding motility-associated C-terminal domain-containing protein [Flavobacteriales bacterium]MBK7943161.1 gliding motility-associated C-terminal domain-containing protein [Flavobacteriales bacterium]MBK9701786.1 gliding motility-associated C-terminal domain-containing protein [Flavobacteriales bacterium]